MTRRPLALAAALLLAACAQPQTATEPAPATRFEPGGGRITELRMEAGQQSLLGTWRGPYAPVDMAAEALTGGPAGVATLEIARIEGSRVHGRMSWEDADQDFAPQPVVGALTMTGHFMILHAHFIMYEQDGVRFLEADLGMPDGRFYRHRLTKVD